MRPIRAAILLALLAMPAHGSEIERSASPAADGVAAGSAAEPAARRRARRAASGRKTAAVSAGAPIVPPGAAPPETDPALSSGPGGIYAGIPAIDDRGRDQHAMFRAWNPDPVRNHERNLASVRPELAAVIRQAQADHPELRFVVGSGRRGEAEQRLAEAWGWSPPAGGHVRNPHLRSHIDGRAVDLWPLDEQGRVTFAAGPMARVGAAILATARRLGVPLSWGGDWRGRKDPAHFELLR